MKSICFSALLLFFFGFTFAQHSIDIKAKVNPEDKTIVVIQEIVYNNSSNDTLKHIVLNDWNNAFSSKNSALAKRFSDEFVRIFHLASEEERGFTKISNVFDQNFETLDWERPNQQIDLLKINVLNPILPCTSQKFTVSYTLKIPHAKFTKYGFNNDGKITLKNSFLSISKYENKQFLFQSNENLDDISNEKANYKININLLPNYLISSDLNTLINEKETRFEATNRQEFFIAIEPKEKANYKYYKNDLIEVVSNFEDKRLNEIQIAIVIDKITKFVADEIGNPTQNKIVVSYEDYEKNPFYGVNQLPSFINPFPDEFIFEIKFLKTYLSNLLKEKIQTNHRKDHWIEEGIQQFLLMKYIDTYHADCKMLGSLSKLKLLKGYNLLNINFNQQFYYVYLLMARKNLDQPIGDSKNTLVKFNEQIAGKYRAGLSLRYLDSFLENDIVLNSIREFLDMNSTTSSSRHDFEYIVNRKAKQDLNWFFRTIIEKRDVIDFKFKNISKTTDSISFTLKNKTETNVPIPVYGLKDDKIVYKQWFSNISIDSTFTIPRNNIDKLVINYNAEVPEFNLRNNWKSLKGFLFNHRPLKFNFLKDLENPNYNQVFYVPVFEYNLYDGLLLGLKFNNKAFLDKPFTFDFTPEYSSNTQKLVGSLSAKVNHNTRIGRLYNTSYSISGSTSHFAPDSKYTRIINSIQFRFRDQNFRTNKNEIIQLAQYYVNRDKTNFAIENTTENYSVFNAKYLNIQSEMTKFYSLITDVQVANSFGKISGEIQYRKLFEDNRRINLRFFTGLFLYKDTSSDFFSFGIDRPTDYLFNQNLLGRSESTGLFSQQYVQAEGGFKSKFDTRFANKWMSSINASFNIWNWIEVYGDIGIVKNKFTRAQFLYDSGIRLNLVPDYFELYFPVYSSNGYELRQDNYDEKIRFVITLSPKTLISLFTRKWF